MPDSSLSLIGVLNYGSLSAMLRPAPNVVLSSMSAASVGYAFPSSGQPRFCSPAQPEMGRSRPKIPEIPASADVAQLVEHFTRNEGVPGSSPGVGSEKAPQMARVCRWCSRAYLVETGHRFGLSSLLWPDPPETVGISSTPRPSGRSGLTRMMIDAADGTASAISASNASPWRRRSRRLRT
jgi:hypothetical protein